MHGFETSPGIWLDPVQVQRHPVSPREGRGIRMNADGRVGELFARLKAGDQSVREELFECVYSALHRLAKAEMAKQRPSHTLQPTALVNEAFLKLGGADPGDWADRAHFLRLAGRAMRQILVDHARGKTTLRRQEPAARVEIDELVAGYEQHSGGLHDLDAALSRLQLRDPEMVQLIELRFFAGRSMEEVAEVLGISVRSAARRWEVARLFLKSELQR